MSELIYRKAEASDSLDLFEWRNDPQTREASAQSGLVAWADHERWFHNKLESTHSVILIFQQAIDDLPKIGMTRIDIDSSGGQGEISINLNPGFRGQGLARQILSDSVAYFFDSSENLKTITAVVRERNIPSKKIFIAAGFNPSHEADGFAHYSLERN